MSILTSALINSIKAAASFVPGINDRAVEFVCHYIGGTQTLMGLTEEEIEYTKKQVLFSLSVGFYDPNTRKGWVRCPNSGNWLTHPTMGVVGGFLFETVQDGDKVLVKCWDEWDFNAEASGGTSLPLPPCIPSSILAAGRQAAKALGVRIHIGYAGVYIAEDDLVRFNEKHRFRTEWEFNLKAEDLIPKTWE